MDQTAIEDDIVQKIKNIQRKETSNVENLEWQYSIEEFANIYQYFRQRMPFEDLSDENVVRLFELWLTVEFPVLKNCKEHRCSI